ncbi:hypothetical protein KVR01_008874 [Diaporthe batatas]|uniref:uncharacterized protein n=1 Tax=Diaporthe batatas TaxID=748121 RepID=UPI001D04D5C9|nr:uncharacterized protein KVR01_008874 [Diaporthe batatas]KAG8161887.1 hypothetical protein KVR01_008874 [Diaporthe batatas]
MEDTSTSGQGRVFHLFSKLPAELRWKIWAFNLPGPRLVSVHCGSKSLSCGLGGRHDHLGPPSSFGCTSQAKIPTNLHVCHESRREALRQYRASFGIARQLGQTFFDSEQDYLYFGPRDGFMASEANLRTVLSLCDPNELAQVRRVAINEALFWVYDSAWHRQTPCHHENHPHNSYQQLQTPPTTPMEDQHHQHRRGFQETNTPLPPLRPLTPQSPSSLSPTPPSAAATMTHASIAASLLVDILRLVRARLPGLRELVLVPRDENPLYSSDCYLTEPAMGQNRLRRQVSEALAAAFGGGGRGGGSGGRPMTAAASSPWEWKIRTLSADPEPPSYDRLVLGWCEAGGVSMAGGGGGWKDGGGGGMAVANKGHVGVTTRLGAVQESARRFLRVEMEVGQ